VINIVKKFLDVTFEHMAWLRVVLRCLAEHFLNRSNSSMCTFADSTRKRSGNECRLKQWHEYTSDRVVQYSISNNCFVNMSLFRVSNIETTVRPMFVRFVFEFPMQCKNALLQIPLKLEYVLFLALVSAKSFPSDEQALGRNY